MSKQSILPLHYKDFVTTTGDWTDEQVGQYMRLLMKQWDEGSISPELPRYQAASPLVKGKFKETEGGNLQNKKMETVRTDWALNYSEKPQKKQSNKKETPTVIHSITLPYDSEEFLSTWTTLISGKKWKGKSASALQKAAELLSENTEEDAIKIMNNAIIGNWQGLFQLKDHERTTNKKGNTNRFTEAKSQIIQLSEGASKVSEQRSMHFDVGSDSEPQS